MEKDEEKKYLKLDAKGLRCPIPVVELRKAIKNLSSGEIIIVEATDPGSQRDFEAWCRKTGNSLLESNEIDGVFTYVIKKGEASK